MTMHCKPWDLAVIVMCPRGTEHLRGKIIRLTKLAEPRKKAPANYRGMDYGPCWHYEGPVLRTSRGLQIHKINDCCLRPIRGGELPEEQESHQFDLQHAKLF